MGLCGSSEAPPKSFPNEKAATFVGLKNASGPTDRKLDERGLSPGQSGILTKDEKTTTWRDPDAPDKDPDARPTIIDDDANVHPFEGSVDVNMPQDKKAKDALPRTNTLAPDDNEVHAFQETEDVDKKVVAAAEEAAAEAEAGAAAPEGEGGATLNKNESVSILTEEEKTTTWKPQSDSDDSDNDDAGCMAMMQTIAPDDRNVHEFSESGDVDALGI